MILKKNNIKIKARLKATLSTHLPDSLNLVSKGYTFVSGVY